MDFPPFHEVALLVALAVLQVVLVAAPGYGAARKLGLDASVQKVLTSLNVNFFTPALVFSKLASKLEADKLQELGIIPLIFFVQVIVSWMGALLVARLFRLGGERKRNFVIAMSVFGNSNSLPVSLVISLAHSVPALRWSQRPNDTAGDVASRGILYLLIFQQLGQLLRWTWGYNSLLSKKKSETPNEIDHAACRGSIDSDHTQHRYRDDDEESLIGTGPSSLSSSNAQSYLDIPNQANVSNDGLPNSASVITLVDATEARRVIRRKSSMSNLRRQFVGYLNGKFECLPEIVQKPLVIVGSATHKIVTTFFQFMSPPLWALILAFSVAVLPPLKWLFYDENSFVAGSVTPAINQLGKISVPLTLVTLGANLANTTSGKAGKQQTDSALRRSDSDLLEGVAWKPKETTSITADSPAEARWMMLASFIGRSVLPTIAMTPLLILLAAVFPIGILGDPVFIVACFLLAGAPTALQVAQICQANDVFMDVMSLVLLFEYIVTSLPMTLVLVWISVTTLDWIY